MSAAALLSLEPLLDDLADRVAARILKAQTRMISQAKSELGPRKHREAVRRRIDEGLDGAAIVGRRFLLTPEALREEAARATATRRRPSNPGTVAKTRGKRPEGEDKPGGLSDFQRELIAGLRALQRTDRE